LTAIATTPDPRRKPKLTDPQISAFALDVGDELSGRVCISVDESTDRDAAFLLQDRDSSARQTVRFSRSADLSEIRRRILAACTGMLLASHDQRKKKRD
jgi:hypothetical protein